MKISIFTVLLCSLALNTSSYAADSNYSGRVQQVDMTHVVSVLPATTPVGFGSPNGTAPSPKPVQGYLFSNVKYTLRDGGTVTSGQSFKMDGYNLQESFEISYNQADSLWGAKPTKIELVNILIPFLKWSGTCLYYKSEKMTGCKLSAGGVLGGIPNGGYIVNVYYGSRYYQLLFKLNSK